MDSNFFQNEDIISDQSICETKPINLKLIETIRSERDLFRLIVSSLCPELIGHELVKSGLVLAVFGGIHKQDFETKVLSIRSQIHVLLFGDHGSNKDLLLKAVHSVSPEAQYVCGNTTSFNSLTKNPKKSQTDESSEDQYVGGDTSSVKKSRTDESFQNGCLVSKDFAICCVDEFERMDNRQHLVVEEVMEHQSVTIASNGVYTEVSANTSIIAAINPLKGSYDWSLNVWQNTNLRKSLLSKFDLIFVLVDFPDEEMDSKLSKDILDSKKCLETIKNESKTILSQISSCDRNDSQLMAKLRFSREEEEPDLIPHELLKQYISYAQTYVNPVLNEEAMDLLEQFCSEFESTVISRSQTRDIETLYRLTEARARVELRPEATKEDVFDVIDIIRHSVGKHFMTPNVVHSIQTLLSFKNSKKSQNTKNLLKALKIISENSGQKEFSFAEIVDICHKFEIPFDSRDQISDSIEILNLQNFLLKTNSNYKLID